MISILPYLRSQVSCSASSGPIDISLINGDHKDILKNIITGFQRFELNVPKVKGGNKHAWSYKFTRLNTLQNKLTNALQELIPLLDQSENVGCKADIKSALECVQNIGGILGELSKERDIQIAHIEEISQDINSIKILEWLLQFVQANIEMQLGNHNEACATFSKLTDTNKRGFQLIKKFIDEHDPSIVNDLLPSIYRNIPSSILEQVENYKIVAYTKAFIQWQGNNSERPKIIHILSEYLEKSFVIMRATAAAQGNISPSLYKPLLDALSAKTSVTIMLNIGQELISLGDDENALECLIQAKTSFKNTSVLNQVLQFDIAYNLAIIHLQAKNYKKVLDEIDVLSVTPLLDEACARYSDLLYIQGIAYNALGREDETIESFNLSIDYVRSNSLILNTVNSQANLLLLEIAVIKDKSELVEKLLSKFPDTRLDYDVNHGKENLFYLAKSNKMVEVLVDNITEKSDAPSNRVLIGYFIDTNNVNIKDKFGVTLLHKMVLRNYKDLVELLISNGAIVNCCDEVGISPLQLATLYNQKEIVQVLLNNDATPNLPVFAGKTALHTASENGNLDILKLLLDKGGDVTLVSRDGDSLIHSAVMGICNRKTGCFDIIEFLLEEKQADPFIENFSHKIPRDILEELGYDSVDHYDDLLEHAGCYIIGDVKGSI